MIEQLQVCVDPGTLTHGVRIKVLSKMGNPVTVGQFMGAQHFGGEVLVHVFGDDGKERVYTDMLYMFVPDATTDYDSVISEETPQPAKQAGGVQPDADPKSDERKAKDDEEAQEPDEVADPNAEPQELGQDVNVDDLPDDIQRAIVGVRDLSEDQLDSVLKGVGDAAVEALQKANVRQSEIYGVVQDIQDAVTRVIEGYNAKQKALKPEPKKKEKPKEEPEAKVANDEPQGPVNPDVKVAKSVQDAD